MYKNLGRLVAAACALALAACTLDPAMRPDGGADDPALDQSMLALVTTYRAFTRIDRVPYVSALGAFDVTCWVLGDAVGYRKIHPERDGSGVTLAVGTVMVREVLDAQGAVKKLTVMAKAPPGYDPSLGDWWFAELAPDGTPLVVAGAPRLGRIEDCHGCHLDRARDDYVFGVPAAAQ